MNPHSDLVNRLLLALADKPQWGKFWKQATGAIEAPNGAWIHYGLRGAADVSGILCSGKRVEIECKTGAGVQSKDQKNFERMITEYRGVYILCRDIQGTLSELEAVCRKS